MARGRGRRRSQREHRQHFRHAAQRRQVSDRRLPRSIKGWAFAGLIAVGGVGTAGAVAATLQSTPATTVPVVRATTRVTEVRPATTGVPRSSAALTTTTVAPTTTAEASTTSSPSTTEAPTTPATTEVATSTSRPTPATTSHPNVPANATALCQDGWISYSAHQSGTCSHHGGIAQWVNRPPT